VDATVIGVVLLVLELVLPSGLLLVDVSEDLAKVVMAAVVVATNVVSQPSAAEVLIGTAEELELATSELLETLVLLTWAAEEVLEGSAVGLGTEAH